jgi:3-phenylpropionate/trans-cinnamate dioxygenase ferredoxin subunit
VPLIDVCPEAELQSGAVRIVETPTVKIGVFNAGGELYAIEDRCSHDDGPLAEGEFDAESCLVVCPRHGSEFDVRTGKPRSLPAYIPVATYPVVVEQGVIKVEVP